ncbi:MAG: hypothetical protein ACKV2T_37285 [Kofleriaceae bacterium]
MSFPWLERTPPRTDGASRRAAAAISELADRAALFYRLGFSEQAATRRLVASIAWEFDQPSTGAHTRPVALSDAAIGKIVSDTYARKPR